MADDIEELEAEYQYALQQTDEALLFAVSHVAPELMQRSYFDPPPTLRPRPTIADYDHDLALMGRPGHDAFGHLRDLVLIGIRVGTISVDDVYRRVRPAMVALTVLLDPGAGQTAAALARRIRRGAGWGVGRGIGQGAGLGVGQGVGRWAEAVVTVDSWPGSLRSLLRQQPREEGDIPVPALLGLDEHLWRGANILLALAPPQTLSHIAAEAAPMAATGRIVGEPQAVRYARALVRIACHAPLSRTVVDHALSPQASARVRMALAGNPLTPNATLLRLLTLADREPGVAAAICLHECTSPAMRLAAYREVRDPEVREQAREALQRDAGLVRRVQLIASATADEAPLVHVLIRDADPDLPPAARLFAYAHLARISGIEAVWMLEMERAGALAQMHPAVRASMESGSAVPLLEAAVADPYRGMHQDTVTSVGMLRREEVLDRPFPWLEPADGDAGFQHC